MLTYDDINGHQFLRLAARLPLYNGALRRRLEMELEQGGSDVEEYEPAMEKRTMSMAEAVAMSQGNEAPGGADMGVLQALSNEGANSGLGSLFEYSTG